MNAQEWNKLVKNWDRLMELFPDEIIVHLYTKQVIDSKDKQEVEAETTRFKKMNKLLDTLKSRPPERKAYDVFLEALEKDKVTAELAKVIRDTETMSDPLLKSAVDPHLLDSDVRTVLHKFLVNKTGASTALSKVREILQSSGVFNGRNDWDSKTLSEFVCKEFVSVEMKDVKKQSAWNSKTETHFNNIALVDLIQTQPSSSEEREHAVNVTSGNNEQQMENAVKVQQMTREQLKEYLQPKMKAQKLPIGALGDIVNKNVTRPIFLTLTKNYDNDADNNYNDACDDNDDDAAAADDDDDNGGDNNDDDAYGDNDDDDDDNANVYDNNDNDNDGDIDDDAYEHNGDDDARVHNDDDNHGNANDDNDDDNHGNASDDTDDDNHGNANDDKDDDNYGGAYHDNDYDNNYDNDYDNDYDS